jgi:hypothetical protein
MSFTDFAAYIGLATGVFHILGSVREAVRLPFSFLHPKRPGSA